MVTSKENAMNRILMTGLLLAAGMLTACAQQDHQRIGPLKVSVAWARAVPAAAPVAGGFLTVQNTGAADDRLLAVETGAAQRVEIHEMRHEGEVMRMRQLADGLALPAGRTVVLQPGGYHLMFIQPARPFVADGQVPATLVFEKAGRLPVVFEVRPMGASAQAPAGDHGHH
jgi:copper(I)-binding protein